MSPAEMIAAARTARDEGMAVAQVADEERGSWDTKVIDQAIKAFADTGKTFSSNDIWPLLPEVRGALIGARFYAASARGYIRKVGRIPSTKKGTHAKDVAVWILADSAAVPTHRATVPDPVVGGQTEMRNLLRTDQVSAGRDIFGSSVTVHVEVSGDPLPHEPDEMQPTVCINTIDRELDADPDQARVEISDPESLDSLITALTAASFTLRHLRREAGL